MSHEYRSVLHGRHPGTGYFTEQGKELLVLANSVDCGDVLTGHGSELTRDSIRVHRQLKAAIKREERLERKHKKLKTSNSVQPDDAVELLPVTPCDTETVDCPQVDKFMKRLEETAKRKKLGVAEQHTS